MSRQVRFRRMQSAAWSGRYTLYIYAYVKLVPIRASKLTQSNHWVCRFSWLEFNVRFQHN